MKRLLWCWLVLAVLVAGQAADVGRPGGDQNLSLGVKRRIDPTFPRALLSDGITSGWARLVIDVNAAGALTDWLVVGHSRPEFGESAIAAVKRWEFAPMIVNGTAVGSQAAITFVYEAKGVVIDVRPGTDLRSLVFRSSTDQVYRPSTMQELDGIPVPLVWFEPPYPPALREKGVAGAATVEFYIDETGTVRMPAIVSAEFPELGELLASTVRQWKFAPPTRRGKPVLVHASQTVYFGNQSN